MPTYNPTQTVFALSMISNSGSSFSGTLAQIEALTAQQIKNYLNEESTNIGPWEVIWGPAIYQAFGSDVADNVMVVFQAGAGSAVPGELVIGIAGTNPASAFDWLLEDFLVVSTVQWPYGNPVNLNPNISLGTYLGLSILQLLTPGPGLPGVGVPLRMFLTSVLTTPTPITVTGHSLGGALSPAVTLWLSDIGFSSLACLPSAGPTPGDLDFSTYYGNQLGNVTTRVHNSIDVVPHAWEADELKELPDLYNPPIPPTLELYGLLLGALGISAASGYTQICPSTAPFQGVFNQDSYKSTNKDCDNYYAQLGYQHVNAYFDYFGIVMPTLLAALAPVVDRQIEKLRSKVQRKQLIRQRSNTLIT
jgi:hypothetical protein